MKIVFFGSSSFSIPVLSALLDSKHQIVLVVTTSPQKKGRGQKLTPTVIQELANQNKLLCVSPENIRTESFLKELKEKNPDFIVVASYGKILPDSVLKIPSKYGLNVHPSLLPRYRGAAPIARQLLNGEKETGVSIARLISKLDAGEILAQLPQSSDADQVRPFRKSRQEA